MSHIETLKERPDLKQIQKQQRTREVGDIDGTYEQITDNPGTGNKTVYVGKSQNDDPTKSSKKTLKDSDPHNIFTAS